MTKLLFKNRKMNFHFTGDNQKTSVEILCSDFNLKNIYTILPFSSKVSKKKHEEFVRECVVWYL